MPRSDMKTVVEDLVRVIEHVGLDDTQLDIEWLVHLASRAKEQIERLVEVVEWKSLYPRAEMAWYAKGLVAEVKGAPVCDLGQLGGKWYERTLKEPPGWLTSL